MGSYYIEESEVKDSFNKIKDKMVNLEVKHQELQEQFQDIPRKEILNHINNLHELLKEMTQECERNMHRSCRLISEYEDSKAAKISDWQAKCRDEKKKSEKLKKEIRKIKRETPKVGRPRLEKQPEYDKWGMLKVKDSNRKYIEPEKAVLSLPQGVNVQLADIAKDRRLTALIRAANCGVKTEKRTIKLLPTFNHHFMKLFREMKPEGDKYVVHPELGRLNLGQTIFNYVRDYCLRDCT